MHEQTLQLHTGGNVDAWCTKCKMVLAHTIVAMVGEKPVRVECNTCGGVHAFKARPPGTSKGSTAAAVARKAKQTKDPEEAWRSLVAAREGAGARTVPYQISAQLQKGDLVDHSKFGMGVVVGHHDDGKMEVQFRDHVRLLVSGRK